MDEATAIPPQTAPGAPITEFDETLVRRMWGGKGSWPIPALLAEIDRLRAIEAAARAMFDAEWGPTEAWRDTVEALRSALSSEVPSDAR